MFFTRYDHLRAQECEAERQAEMLFQGLLQRAFEREAVRLTNGPTIRH